MRGAGWLAGCLMAALTVAVASGAPGDETPISAEEPSAAESSPTAEPLEIMGVWYVLIHYRDSAESDAEAMAPEVEHWEDRVWRFELRRGGLRWTEYPVAIFVDKSDRFDRIGSALAPTEQFWEPNARQRDEIRNGLASRSDGVRSKNLRGSRERGFASGGGTLAASTSMLSYEESWKIDGLSALPTFAQDAALGGGRAEAIEGRTRFEVTEVREGGEWLVGRYERDRTRTGRFQLFRSMPPRIGE